MTQVIEPVWLDIRSAAQYLGLSTQTIERYVDRGLLTMYKVPGAHNSPVRYRREELDRLMVPVQRKGNEQE